jgi:hypothetical protein
VDRGCIGFSAVEILECRRFYEFPGFALIPGTPGVDFTVIAFSRRIVEELVYQLGGGGDFADAKGRLAHAFQRQGEGSHMGDFSGHEKLERVFGAGVPTEVDQALINDFRPRLRCNIAAQVDVEFAGDLEVVRCPSVAHGIVEVHTTPTRDSDQGIDLSLFSDKFQRLEVQAGQSPDDLQVAEFFCPDVHEQVFAAWIVTVETLDRVLHGRSELAIGAAELLEQHVAERGVRLIDPNRVHELLDVVIHLGRPAAGDGDQTSPAAWR